MRKNRLLDSVGAQLVTQLYENIASLALQSSSQPVNG